MTIGSDERDNLVKYIEESLAKALLPYAGKPLDAENRKALLKAVTKAAATFGIKLDLVCSECGNDVLLGDGDCSLCVDLRTLAG